MSKTVAKSTTQLPSKVSTKASTKASTKIAAKQVKKPFAKQPLTFPDGGAWAAKGVRLVLAQFTDMNGTAKGKLLPITQ